MNTIQKSLTVVLTSLALCACAPKAIDPGAAFPALADMQFAAPTHSTIGVPVDVRYQLSGAVAKDQPAILQLAFVPRVAGAALRVEFPASPTVSVETGNSPMSMQKAQAADVYRRTVMVTPRSSDGGKIQVIVSMDIDGGRYFSIFTIPVGGAGQTNQ